MVTKNDMKRFLREEGWKFTPGTKVKSKFWMKDPHNGDSYGWGLVEVAYKLAYRRKRKRESAQARKRNAQKPSSVWKGC